MSENSNSRSTPGRWDAAPIVSIIIPCHNCARYVSQALDSVFAQAYQDCEVIVVDDGSTDETAQILQAYQPRIRTISQSNAGSAAARNRGLSLARGRYVVFLDADDLLLAGKLQEQVGFLEKRPYLGAVHSGWRLIDDKGRAFKEMEPWHEAPLLDLSTWLKWKPVKLGAMMIRRSWLDRVGGLDPELLQSHDVDLMLRLALAGCRVEWMYKPTLAYRRHPASVTRRESMNQAKYALLAIDKFFARSKLPAEIRMQEQRTRYYSTMWVAWHLYRTGFMAETAPYLLKTLKFTPYSVDRTVLDWLRHFAKWSDRDGEGTEKLRRMWPHLRKASQVEDAHWERIEVTLNWWLDVWRHYLEDRRNQAFPALRGYRDMEPCALVQLVQFCIATRSESVTADLVTAFWQDAVESKLLPSANRHDVIALYLTLFGQAILSCQWRGAAAALVRAISVGPRPTAITAWARFMRAALIHSPRLLGRRYWRNTSVERALQATASLRITRT